MTTLTERYLKAVAAQLPAETRDDIIAELRDLLLTRMEAREAALGRPLSEAEEEEVLRDYGHPLLVAGRYGAGPQAIVGPELYPWWMFGVKMALLALIALSVVGVLLRALVGDDLGQAIGHGFAGLFDGGITVVGLATIAAFIIERQARKPKFLTEWRARDLELFELGGFSAEAVSRRMSAALAGDRSGEGIKPVAKPNPMSPKTRALGSAAIWTVVLLWWIGALGGSVLAHALDAGFIDGVDYGNRFVETIRLLHWPVTAAIGARIVFDLIRASRSGDARFTALGDIAWAAAGIALAAWLWAASPFSSLIAVPSIQSFFDQVRAMFAEGEFVIATIVRIMIGMSVISGLVEIARSTGRLANGR